MTRIELYKSYREEIAKSSRLGKSIKDSDADVTKYNKAINKINHSILHSIKDTNLKFDIGVLNIDVESNQLSQEVMNYFQTLNKIAINQQQDQINNFFHNNINHSIVNKKNEFDQTWMESNKDYSQIVLINTMLANNFTNEEEFVNSLTDQYNTMSQPTGINKIVKLNEVKAINKKDTLRKAMISVSVILIVMLVALLALIIVRGIME